MSAWKYIVAINAVFALCLTNCSHLPVKSDKAERSGFHVKIVPNEFIVQFTSHYFKNVRESFIRKRLVKTNVTDWSIESRRSGTGVNLPSDFDVIHVFDNNELLVHHALNLVRGHPSVKAVVHQRSVRRLLTYTYHSNSSFILSNRSPKGVARKKTAKKVDQQYVTEALHADVLWNLGITGRGAKVAIFDTGLTQNHPHFRNVKERTNWTNEKSLDDAVSHGTFVAGVIGASEECPGLAPDAELHIYKVFTNSQVSYTSWFLDAFNYAIYRKVDIVNLSIGGPDFMDSPFVEKVLELSANNIIMISAAGNDGPLFGTLNNPGDQSDVIGVGSINFDDKIARFSSRGMTTWELPLGYGRAGLDIVTYGSQVASSDVHSGCRRLSGTSVSSPVVAGVAALLRSGAYHKRHLINPASLKQVIIEGAEKLPNYSMFEQGQGKLNLLRSMQLLLAYKPKVSFVPSSLDFTSSFMWPYSSQDLFYGSTPVIVNVTILNGVSVMGKVVRKPKWIPDPDSYGSFLNISASYSNVIWPWTGWMSVYIAVSSEAEDFEGIGKGRLILLVDTYPFGTNKAYRAEVNLFLTIKIIPKPPRNKRILWDQYHNLRYPPGYIPRDNLKIKTDPLDWRADHVHTNFRDAYIHLRNSGYYIDVLRQPYTCFDPLEYGALLIVDPEEEFFDEEIKHLEHYVYEKGLGLIVFADWYNTTVMRHIKFFDENSRQWWIPDTGGSNIPALNDLLRPFGVSFGDFVGEGYFKLGDHSMYYASGATLHSFPKNGHDGVVVGANLIDQGLGIITNSKASNLESKHSVPILGLFQTSLNSRQPFQDSLMPADYTEILDNTLANHTILKNRILLNDKSNSHVPGRIAVYGDSNCLDSTNMDKACFWLLTTFLDYVMNSHKSMLLEKLNQIEEFTQISNKSVPLRIPSSNLHCFSKVKFRKILKIQCEELEWISESEYDENVVNELYEELSSTDSDGNHYNVIEHLSSELDKLAFSDDRLEFNMPASIFFLTMLSVTVIVLFYLFIQGKIASNPIR